MYEKMKELIHILFFYDKILYFQVQIIKQHSYEKDEPCCTF